MKRLTDKGIIDDEETSEIINIDLPRIKEKEIKKEEKKTNISIVQTDKIERIEKRDY